MKKTIIIFIALSMFVSCESIDEYRRNYQAEISAREASQKSQNYRTPRYEVASVKHPDLNFPPSDLGSIVIYEGFTPLDKNYFVIGGIGVVEYGEFDSYMVEEELRTKAAEMGGHAVIMIDTKSDTKEFDSGMSGFSVPRYFWWDDEMHYIGSDYYWLRMPTMTFSTYSRIYVVVKFEKKFMEEVAINIKNRYPYLEKKEILELMEEKDESEKPKYDYNQIIDILLKGSLKRLIDDVKKEVDNDIAKFKKVYPLAEEKEIWKLLAERDEEGNQKYTVEEAMKISHMNNLKKKKKKFPS